jgi:hypothetical protein
VLTTYSWVHIYKFLQYFDVINQNEKKYIFIAINIFALKNLWLKNYSGIGLYVGFVMVLKTTSTSPVWKGGASSERSTHRYMYIYIYIYIHT